MCSLLIRKGVCMGHDNDGGGETYFILFFSPTEKYYVVSVKSFFFVFLMVCDKKIKVNIGARKCTRLTFRINKRIK